MNLTEYLGYVESRELSVREQAQLMDALNEDGRSLEEVDQEDLDELAEDVGAFSRALGAIVSFFSKLF